MRSFLGVIFFWTAFGFSVNRINGKNIGSFWHLTDLHLDPNYNSTYGDPERMCWVVPKGEDAKYKPGVFGDRACDAPKILIESALNAMREIDGTPDFIIWTGDDTTHVSDVFFSTDKVVEVIRDLTYLIKDAFPTTLVFPVLGNHDFFPKNQFPPGPNALQCHLADLWKDWLDEVQAYDDFKQAAQYSARIPNTNVTLIGLNTVLWYKRNDVTAEDPTADDPAGLFESFKECLKNIKDQDGKAMIIGHIAPGKSERYKVDPLPKELEAFQPRYNKKYLEIIDSYSSIITAQFFGHIHTDSFRVFLSEESGDPISYLLLAAAISPINFPGEDLTNPSFKRIFYDRTTGEVEEVSVYYLDLDEANLKGYGEWKFEFNLTSLLELKKIDHFTLYEAAKRFMSKDSGTFDKYYAANSGQYYKDASNCTDECRKHHFCALTQMDYELFHKCVQSTETVSA